MSGPKRVPGYELTETERDPGFLDRLRAKLRIGDPIPAELMKKSPYRESDGGLPGGPRAQKGHAAAGPPRPVSVQAEGWDQPISEEKVYIPHHDDPVQLPRMNRYPGGADQFREDLNTAMGRNQESWLRQRGPRRRGVY